MILHAGVLIILATGMMALPIPVSDNDLGPTPLVPGPDGLLRADGLDHNFGSLVGDPWITKGKLPGRYGVLAVDGPEDNLRDVGNLPIKRDDLPGRNGALAVEESNDESTIYPWDSAENIAADSSYRRRGYVCFETEDELRTSKIKSVEAPGMTSYHHYNTNIQPLNTDDTATLGRILKIVGDGSSPVSLIPIETNEPLLVHEVSDIPFAKSHAFKAKMARNTCHFYTTPSRNTWDAVANILFEKPGVEHIESSCSELARTQIVDGLEMVLDVKPQPILPRQ
ncbi:hypothetical protein BJ875DRAFT_444499 [Amylocarpus encephaloides]|uniref:Uncharacterized protein n=1 Tax=Amylocarpus encephaloides TaxID=45428 RepID=A0A9P8C2I2_9HELO|nr:hypothetical protein BJ875DRAFT_444499 [Amylocarpus encephaloides]